MTTTKTIQLLRTGLTLIDIEPVWVDDEVQLFDIFIDGEWQGSRRLLSYIEKEYGIKHR